MIRKRVAALAAWCAVSLGYGDIALSDVEGKYGAIAKVEASDTLEQRIDIGFANTTGNSDTLNFNGAYNAAFTTEGYDDKALKVAFKAAFFYDENNGETNNEEYIAALNLEQSFANGWLMYGTILWLRNPEFKNYDHKFSFGIGFGKTLFDDGTQYVKVTLGAAYNIEDYANAQPTRSFGSLNEYAEYGYRFNPVSSLYIKAGSQQNMENFSDDYELNAVVGFRFAVAEHVHIVIEEEVMYDHLPPAGFKTTDTRSVVKVGYRF